jgi:AsmA protein
MKPRQLAWKWLLFGLLATIIAGALSYHMLPDSSRVADRVAAELSAWTGGKASFSGPVRVRYFPDVSIRGKFELSGGTRLPFVKSIVTKEAKVSLSLIDLLRGRVSIDALRLVRPRIVLTQTNKNELTQPQDPRNLADALFAHGSVRVIHVRDGTLVFRTDSGLEVVNDIDAHLDGSDGQGSVSSFGSFVLRNETLRFALDSTALTKDAETSTLPLTLTLTSAPMKTTIVGKAIFGKTATLSGDMRAEIDNVRRFAVWAGIDVPNGSNLNGFTASGIFRIAGPTLTFDDGNFTLDGNSAVGLLAITKGATPRIEATLAFDRLALDPYIEPEIAEGQPIGRLLFDRALLRHFDADLRLSAGAIAAGKLKLGHGAFTITAKEDAIVSEVSEVELCGGTASGRLSTDDSQVPKRLSLTASVADVAIDSCLAQLGLDVPLQGIGGARIELASEGHDAVEVIHGLTGGLKVKARSGTVPIDLSRLVTAPAPLEADSWSRDKATAFDTLNADCRVAAGHIWCQMFNMQTPNGVVAGSGDVDLPRQALDWNLSVTSSQRASAKASTTTASEPPKLSIRGPLTQPSIRRAGQQALGEGTVGTIAPIVSPR